MLETSTAFQRHCPLHKICCNRLGWFGFWKKPLGYSKDLWSLESTEIINRRPKKGPYNIHGFCRHGQWKWKPLSRQALHKAHFYQNQRDCDQLSKALGGEAQVFIHVHPHAASARGNWSGSGAEKGQLHLMDGLVQPWSTPTLDMLTVSLFSACL